MSRHNRRAQKVDDNQPEIVRKLQAIPSVSVEVGHDDLLIGFEGNNYWVEIKNPETEISKKTGRLKDGALTNSEKIRLTDWLCHYCVAWTLEQILEEIGIEV